jgi:hypothetical protein
MTEPAASIARIRDVAAKYEAWGYEILFDPLPNQLPDFLRGYRPDFLARRPGDSVLVEVKARASAAVMDRYQDLIAQVHSYPGWRFDLVVTNPPNSLPLGSDYPVLPFREIERRYDEAEELLHAEHIDAALLIAWAATEAALRFLAQLYGAETQRSATPSLLKQLATDGVISRNQYDVLWRSYQERSAVAHGFARHEDDFGVRQIIESGRALLREAGRLP